MSRNFIHFDYTNYEFSSPELVKGRTIVLRHVLEHIPDPKHFLKKIISYKPNFLYIAVPNFDRPERKVFGPYDLLLGLPFHLWHFDKKSLFHIFNNLPDTKVIAWGHDTIPTIAINFALFLNAKKCPKIIVTILTAPFMAYGLLMPLNLFFPNNVIWLIVKIKNDE